MGGALVAGGAAGKGGEKQYKEVVEAWRKLVTSDFDSSKLSPVQLKILGERAPQLVQGIIPDKFIKIADSPEVRDKQLKTLNYLEQVQQEGLPTADRMQALQAQEAVRQASKQTQDEVLRDVAQRGSGVSGVDEAALRLVAGQREDALSRNLGRDMAMQREQRQLGVAGMLGQQAGALRGQDINVQARNAAIANERAAMVAEIQNRAALANQRERAAAEAYNTQTRQQLGTAQELANYENRVRNQEYGNQMKQAQFGQQLAKTQGLTGALAQYGAYKDRLRDIKAQGIMNASKGVGQIGDSVLGGVAGGGGGLLGSLYG